MVSKGDKSLAHGTDLDRGMLKQTSEILGRMDENKSGGLEFNGELVPRKEIDDHLDGILGNFSGDHQAVHDFVTGDPAMGATIAEGGQYNATDHVMDVLQHSWGDRQGAGQMFEWLGGPEANTPQAGDTANTLAHILADKNDVLAPTGTEVKSIGEASPQLTQSLTKGLSPYLGNFAGLDNQPPGVLTNQGHYAFGDVKDLSHLFKTLDTDPGAAQIINGAGSQWVDHLAYENGANPQGPALGNSAGLLSHAMHDGLSDRISDLHDADKWDQVVEFNKKSQAFDIGAALAGKVPGVSEVSGIASPIVKPLLLDLPNNPADHSDNAWANAVKPLEQIKDPDSTQSNFNLVDGYAQANPAIRDQFVDRDGQSFFNPDGHLDWDRVNASQSYFDRARNDLSAPSIDGFRQDYQDGLNDPTISDTGTRPPR